MMNEKKQLKLVIDTVNRYFKILKEQERAEANKSDSRTIGFLSGLRVATDDVLSDLGIDTNPILNG